MNRQIFSAPAAGSNTQGDGSDAAPDPTKRPMVHSATRIETPEGPRSVETLKAGDRVVVHGADPARLDEVIKVVMPRADWAYAPGIWPIRVPVGVLGNSTPMRASPGMRVLVPGEAGVFAMLSDLVGIGGVARDRPMADIRYFELHTPEHALLRMEGALLESAPSGPRLVREQADRETARQAFARATGSPIH